MIVKLFDKSEIQVTKLQSERIKQAIQNGVQHIEIGEIFVKTSAIATITPGGKSEADLTLKSLPTGQTDHRGENSPTLEKIKQNLKLGKSFKQIAKEL